MKKLQKNPFRVSKDTSRKDFVTAIIKLKKEHLLILPDEVVKAFDLQVGDIAIFESFDGCVSVKFVKKTMFSFVEKLDIEKLLKNKKIDFGFIGGNIENDAIIFGKR